MKRLWKNSLFLHFKIKYDTLYLTPKQFYKINNQSYMWLEQASSHLNEWPSIKDTPEYQEHLNQRVKKIEEWEKNYKHLVQVNNVLNVLDMPDEQEQIFRQTLDNLDSQVLKDLTTKTRWEILGILTSGKLQERSSTLQQNYDLKSEESNKQNLESEAQNKEYQETDDKYEKIKNILPDWIYNWDSKYQKLVQALNSFDNLQALDNSNENNNQKVEALKVILNELKNRDVLNSIVKELGWANPNNPQYQEFKNTLIGLDPSFKELLAPLERIEQGMNLDSNDVVKWIENDSWGMIDIDLKSNISKLHLPESDYNFEKEFDKQELWKLQTKFDIEMKELKRSTTSLKGLYKPFASLFSEVGSVNVENNFQDTLKSSVSKFQRDAFNDMDNVYENMDIDSSIQINEADINSLASSKTPEEFNVKRENILEKFRKIAAVIENKKETIEQNYSDEIKELTTEDSETQKKQVEVLKYLKSSGFDLIPKEITDRLINSIQAGLLIIPWLDLSIQNIDLSKWYFWENSAFIDKSGWINIGAKTNLVKFMNKLITWDINEPLSVEGISNWVTVANPAFLQNKFLESNIATSMNWNYWKMVENLKKDITS